MTLPRAMKRGDARRSASSTECIRYTLTYRMPPSIDGVNGCRFQHGSGPGTTRFRRAVVARGNSKGASRKPSPDSAKAFPSHRNEPRNGKGPRMLPASRRTGDMTQMAGAADAIRRTQATLGGAAWGISLSRPERRVEDRASTRTHASTIFRINVERVFGRSRQWRVFRRFPLGECSKPRVTVSHLLVVRETRLEFVTTGRLPDSPRADSWSTAKTCEAMHFSDSVCKRRFGG